MNLTHQVSELGRRITSLSHQMAYVRRSLARIEEHLNVQGPKEAEPEPEIIEQPVATETPDNPR